ncbi:hypothetical protein SISSUDRAFT_1046968 [Sistotremastrum suecicum HHB10207 ss-3]|uniref:Uncharacterized protein n=1 Tax=Sistotremastrum suecicum HHB10207 ss-3 TaxID=1314776 RepID=A0A166DE40_9AGAM|nr:hypothetical protein SISSUDRAFT_1046968 [Sistotremastrum suecicum HHB10207 ss-3]
MTSTNPSDLRTLHLIYIHGFQGDQTSFQAFPTDLHSYLEDKLGLGVELKSSLYPTYKSRRPIREATSNFLTWLSTQPTGDVILFGHSMGGLLAAEAAVAHAHHKPKRERQQIVAVVALDAPLLGMHPHVVISGIASLFPKKKDKNKAEHKSDSHQDMQKDGESVGKESDMNDSARVRLVKEGEVKRTLTLDGRQAIAQEQDRDSEDPEWEKFKSSLKIPPTPSINSRESGSAHSASSSPPLTPLPSPPTSPPPKKSFFEKGANLMQRVSNDPFVKFIRKHNDDPFGAAKKEIVEHFEFGSCMFDPKGLMERYQKLEKWNGKWLNFWTRTIVHDHSGEDNPSKESSEESDIESAASVGTDSKDDGSHLQVRPEIVHQESSSSVTSTASSQQSIEHGHHRHHHLVNEEKCRVVNCRTHPRHFIVLPFTNSKYYSRWQLVEIAGVDDEVQAHCGIFIRTQNLDYEAFVERVGKVIIGWQQDSHHT